MNWDTQFPHLISLGTLQVNKEKKTSIEKRVNTNTILNVFEVVNLVRYHMSYFELINNCLYFSLSFFIINELINAKIVDSRIKKYCQTY